MPSRPRIIGSYVSPCVRKVLVCLELKGSDYEYADTRLADALIWRRYWTLAR